MKNSRSNEQKDQSDINQTIPKNANYDSSSKTTNTRKAKLISDRLLASNDKKEINSLFDMWGLTAEDVAKAEKSIIEIEEKVDECCPIRGSQNRKITHDNKSLKNTK